jgi:hypothetical protein
MAIDDLHPGAINQLWSTHEHDNGDAPRQQRLILLFALVAVTFLLVGIVIHRVAEAEREEARRYKER